jgi:hypothetical protein
MINDYLVKNPFFTHIFQPDDPVIKLPLLAVRMPARRLAGDNTQEQKDRSSTENVFQTNHIFVPGKCAGFEISILSIGCSDSPYFASFDL